MRWKEHPIADCVGKCQTWNPKSSVAGSFDYIDLSSVDKDTKSIASIERYECSDAPSRARQLVEADDVLVATVRPNLNGVALVNGAHHGMTASTGYCVLRPKKDKLDSRFLFHWVKTDVFVRRMVDVATGANYPAVSDAKVKASKIPLPPLADQKRIARFLDAVDALRAKRREALAQLDTLLQSTFLDMFGDPVTNPMGWEEEHLANLVSKRKHSLKRGPFGGALKKEIFVAEGFKVYEQKNVIYNDFDIGSYFVKDSDYERMISFRVQPNDLLISCSGTIGRIAAVPVNAAPGIMNQALLKITLDESRMLNVFFLDLWRSDPFERQVLGMTHGTGMKNMKSMGELKSIRFPAPPVGLQRRFAAIVESVERQKARQRAHLAELDTLFASLQSRAFRGDL